MPFGRPKNRKAPEASVTAVALTGPLSSTHQPARPAHGDASACTPPSSDAVPPAAGELTQRPADAGGGGGKGSGAVDGSGEPAASTAVPSAGLVHASRLAGTPS